MTLIIVMLLAAQSTAAAETLSKPYLGGSPSVFGRGVGILIHEYDRDGDGEPEVPAIGGNRLLAGDVYRHAALSISDDLFGPDGGYNACFHPPGSDTIGTAHCTGSRCGAGLLLASPYDSDRLDFWTRAIVVQEDLTVCGALTGTFTGTFF